MKKTNLIEVCFKTIIFMVAVVCVMQFNAFTSKASLRGDSVEEQIFYYLKDEMGLSNAAACGILGNVRAESNFNPKALGDGGTSYGICQWHSSRWTDMKTYCNANGYDWTTLEGQLHFLTYELSNVYTVTYGIIYDNNDNVDASNTENGAYNVGYYFCINYEKPANAESKAQYRGNLAKNTYWPKYSSYTDDDDEDTDDEESEGSYLTTGKVYTVDGIKYKALSKKTVGVKGATNKKITSLTIGDKVTIDGRKYPIVRICDGAFKNYKKLVKVTLGTRITVIGKNAFYNCKKLKKIVINSEDIETFKSNAFVKIKAKAKIFISECIADEYEPLIKAVANADVKIKYIEED